MLGRYRITTINKDGSEKSSPWIKNLVMEGVSNGSGIITRQLINDTSLPIGITSGEIGSGSTAPAISDTDLQTPILTGIVIRTKVATATTATIKFFITDAELANGTYREFGLRCGARLFARSLISPVFTKASGQDVIIEYEITIT